MTTLALPLVAAGSIQASLASAAVIENAFSPGCVVNISPEMTGCPRAGSCVDRRDAWSTRWHGQAIPEPWRYRNHGTDALVAAVARNECTHRPLTSALMPVSQAVFANDVAIDRGRIEVAVKAAGTVVLDRAEEGALEVTAMPGQRQILLARTLRRCIDWNKADLGALAVDPKMQDALAAVQILDPETAELLAANAVIEQGGQNGAVAHPLVVVTAGGASSSLRACRSPSAGVLPSLPLAIGRLTPSTGLPSTALRRRGNRTAMTASRACAGSWRAPVHAVPSPCGAGD